MRFQLRRKRLRILVQAIEAHERFTMHVWARHSAKHRPPERNYCNTAACALGTGAMVPQFQREGLRMYWEKTWGEEWDGIPRLYKDKKMVAEGREAGRRFFGLSVGESRLFHQGGMEKAEVLRWLTRFSERRHEDQELFWCW